VQKSWCFKELTLYRHFQENSKGLFRNDKILSPKVSKNFQKAFTSGLILNFINLSESTSDFLEKWKKDQPLREGNIKIRSIVSLMSWKKNWNQYLSLFVIDFIQTNSNMLKRIIKETVNVLFDFCWFSSSLLIQNFN